MSVASYNLKDHAPQIVDLIVSRNLHTSIAVQNLNFSYTHYPKRQIAIYLKPDVTHSSMLTFSRDLEAFMSSHDIDPDVEDEIVYETARYDFTRPFENLNTCGIKMSHASGTPVSIGSESIHHLT